VILSLDLDIFLDELDKISSIGCTSSWSHKYAHVVPCFLSGGEKVAKNLAADRW
jgi:hypothetical protein